MTTLQLFDGTITGITDEDSIEFSAAGVSPGQKQDPFIGLSGTFGGATVSLIWVNPDNEDVYTDASTDYWTTQGLAPLYLNSFSKYKLTITGATGSTAIKAWGFGVNAV